MAETSTFDSCVRGYHVYKEIWNYAIGDTLTAKPEFGNVHDPYAVAVVTSDDVVVGHLPRNISTLCHLLLRKSGHILVQVTGRRKRSTDLPQGRLEVPCSLTFVGEARNLLKVRRLMETAVPALSLPGDIQPPWKRSKICAEGGDTEEECDGGDTEEECDSVWVTFERLSLIQKDKEVLLRNGKLNDRHINYAQRMLHSQFPQVEGLGHTLLQKRKQPKKIESGLQIIHDRGDHWVVASNVAGHDKVQVYDSVYSAIDQGTKEVISNLFQLSNNPVIEIAEMQKQREANQCGLFAIAVATNILSSISTQQFQEQHMRSHLVACLENNAFTPFP